MRACQEKSSNINILMYVYMSEMKKSIFFPRPLKEILETSAPASQLFIGRVLKASKVDKKNF